MHRSIHHVMADSVFHSSVTSWNHISRHAINVHLSANLSFCARFDIPDSRNRWGKIRREKPFEDETGRAVRLKIIR